MTSASDLVVATIRPALVGTAFDDADAQGVDRSGGAAYLLWCTPTANFRARHPGVPAALDLEHPDGCTDLTVELDDNGRLVRADLEMLDLAPDLLGTSAETALPRLAERLRRLLGPPRSH